MNKRFLKKFALLFVDDEANIRSSLKRIFSREEYQLYEAGNAEEALELMSGETIHAALIDLKMPGMDGLTLLNEIRQTWPNMMVIMLTGHGTIKDAVQAVRAGAQDFIEKPFIVESLTAKVYQLFKLWRLEQENLQLKNDIGLRFKYEKLVGISPAALELKKTISRIGPSDATVLIEGETGTGKELVAKAIHYHSPRAKENFVVVDCTTINETMLESELFGHVKGAFTGAHKDSTGLIKAAHKGTLFFDEIGELPLQTQAKLLRVIQEKEIRPAGSNRSVKVDIRILAATNRDLKTEIMNNGFREDLYYRLDTVNINVPALKDRIEDIPLLVDYFIKRVKTEHSTVREISKDALTLLENYSWPGNIRELENLIRRVTALSRDDKILVSDLPGHMTGQMTDSASSHAVSAQDDSLAAYEEAAIANALQKSGNRRKKAAQLLGIGEATLYRKINKYWPDK